MNVLLDLDGTLTDSRPGIVRCVRHALAELGLAAPADLDHCVGPPLHDSLRELLGAHAQRLDEAIAAYRQCYSEGGMLENRVYPGIAGALGALGTAGARLFVVTSKPHVYARRILAHFDLEAHFDAVFGAELDGTHADKPSLIAHTLQQASLPAGDCVMVGDRRHDIEGARANAVPALGVLWGYGSHEELTGAGATWLCDTPGRLPAMLLEGARS